MFSLSERNVKQKTWLLYKATAKSHQSFLESPCKTDKYNYIQNWK